jgi:hypothetical protein
MAEILFEQIATSGAAHVSTSAVRQFMTGHRLPQDSRFVRTLRHKLGRRPKRRPRDFELREDHNTRSDNCSGVNSLATIDMQDISKHCH